LILDISSQNNIQLFSGIVLYVTKKLASLQSELHEIATLLGGEFRHSYCPEVTHVIFSGKSNDVTKEFKVAKADKKYIVAPDWVFMCKNEKKVIEVT
jgi:ribosomal protein L39E